MKVHPDYHMRKFSFHKGSSTQEDAELSSDSVFLEPEMVKKSIFSCSSYVMKSALSLFFFGSIVFGVFRILNDLSGLHDHKIRSPISPLAWESLLLEPEHRPATDAVLIHWVRSDMISPAKGPYGLELPVKEHSLELAVRQLTNLSRGYFVEVGAGDGASRSPTLALESEDQWTGLLIEADPRIADQLLTKKRKCTVSKTCVGHSNVSYTGSFGLKNGFQSRLLDDRWTSYDKLIQLQCSPLYTHLLAVRKTRVDFLVININRGELHVLWSLPWTKLHIRVIAVRFSSGLEQASLRKYMSSQGYIARNIVQDQAESFVVFLKKTK